MSDEIEIDEVEQYKINVLSEIARQLSIMNETLARIARAAETEAFGESREPD